MVTFFTHVFCQSSGVAPHTLSICHPAGGGSAISHDDATTDMRLSSQVLWRRGSGQMAGGSSSFSHFFLFSNRTSRVTGVGLQK